MRSIQAGQWQRSVRRAVAVRVALVALASAIGGASCADAESAAPATPDEMVEDGPAFVVSTRIWDDSSITSYFHVLPALDADAVVDHGEALEVGGSARLFAFEGIGWFAVGSGDAPRITRYELDARNALVPDKAISLDNFGVQGLWNTMYLVSPTKAYYPDREGRQLVIWNPTSMVVEGAISLPETARDGYLSLYGYSSVLRGSKLIFSVGWFDWDSTDSILDETALVTIDTERDSVERVDLDTRCGGITELVELASGDVYFVSSALAGAAYRLERMTSEPCALRMPKDVNALDPDYLVRLRDLTGGALAGDPIPGADGGVFIRVLDEQLAEVTDETLTYEITGQSAWRWLSWNPETNAVSEVTELPAAPANVAWFKVDGKVYTIEEKNDSTESTVIDLTAEGGPQPVFTAPGYLHAMARVR